MEHEFDVLFASDGAALLFLQKEFPELESLELPSYNIRYPKRGRFFKWKMISLLPTIYQTMENEKKIIKRLVDEGKIHGIISDGRFGVRHPLVPSVFITHQLNVITGTTTFFSSRMYQKLLKKFDTCWVPDIDHEISNFSGKLGRLKRESIPISYLGILSRMKKKELPTTIDILVLLSGPEPQRSMLEEKLMKELVNNTQRILIVQGIVEAEQKWEKIRNINKVNFMKSEELEDTLNKSEVVICRSGYSTIMDLAVLEKKVFFIPTPGQYEQEYLAKRMESLGIAPSCSQDRFKLKDLNRIAVYKGLKSHPEHQVDISSLFGLF